MAAIPSRLKYVKERSLVWPLSRLNNMQTSICMADKNTSGRELCAQENTSMNDDNLPARSGRVTAY